MLKDPAKLKLGGDKKDLTVLFSDIRGFTTISEKLTPEELVALLNEYLTAMTNKVFSTTACSTNTWATPSWRYSARRLTSRITPAGPASPRWQMMKELHQLQKKWKAEGRPGSEYRHRHQLRRYGRRQHGVGDAF